MPVSATWGDTAYHQQFAGNLTISVTAPTKVDKIVFLDNVCTDAERTQTEGFQYFSTTDNVVKYYLGGAWHDEAPRTRQSDGTLYFSVAGIGANFFRYWDGSTLQYLMYGAGYLAYKGVYWYLKSIGTAPTPAEKDDSYYNSADHLIYRYNGAAWVSVGAPVTTLDKTHMYGYMWYVTDEIVSNPSGETTIYHPILWYNPVRHVFERRYERGTVNVQTADGLTNIYTLYVHSLRGKTETTACTLQYPGTDDATQYRIVVGYTDNSGRTPGNDYLPDSAQRSESIYTQYAQGRNGSISDSLTVSAPQVTYLSTTDKITAVYTVYPTAQNTASILIPISDTLIGYEGFGVNWYLTRNGGFSGMSLEDANRNGYIALETSTSPSDNTYNKSTVSIIIRESGTYTLQAQCVYRNSSNIVASASRAQSIAIYSQTHPAITIAAGTTPDPSIYPPPYTVTLRDNSATADPYQVPQQSITIDAGDNQNPESWTLENSGSAVITMPDKVHIYTGYGAYRPTLTIVDKNGNSATATTSFSPNKTARTYLPAGWTAPARIEYGGTNYYGTLSPNPATAISGGNAPILLTCRASVAGDPLPVVTWAYYLSGQTQYYSGESVGPTAELSLLSAGTYDVTCTIATSPQVVYRWSVTVQNEIVSTDADKQIEDFALVVLNGTAPVDWCRVHTTPQYTTRWQESDTVQFEVPRNYRYAQYLQEGDLFVFGHHGAKLCQVSYRQQNEGTITISGSAVFPQRVAIAATRSSANDGYDVQTCSAEALIRYFVHSALADPYGTQPRGANLQIHGTCQDLPSGGEPVTYSARYDNLQDIVTEICSTSGLGYSVGIRETASGAADLCQLWIREGTDRTYTTGGYNARVFSPKRGNCTIVSDQSALSPNVAIGAGAGIGDLREYAYYDADGQTPVCTGYARRETFVDAGDAADSDEAKRVSVLELKQNLQLSIRIRVSPTAIRAYGSGYDVGDIVTLVHPDRGNLDLQIYSAEHVQRADGDELYLNLGSRALTAPALIARVEKSNTYARK